ncbi:MAG: alpha/beta fold hydrolase [Acidobacteria bacterium]|nr:alpha/beta fold hydrolase [Acidobacteriota bacterium]MBI3261797.1 alpha/beta fold hydrolase [Acidobacteriota bacterium]
MTLYVWGRPRHFPALPAPAVRYFDVAPGARVMAHCHWQTSPAKHPTLVVLHGLEGSSSAPYMLGIADKAWTRGFNVVRVNQRNCGGTEHLSDSLYHSGLTNDPDVIMRELIEVDGLRAIGLAGYSLGGNLSLKLAGEYGEHAPREFRSVVAVSPTMELAVCVEALERRDNWIYQWNFVRNLKRRMRRKARAWPGKFPLDALPSVRTVREFDERFTAPHHGFRDAADYYHRASAARVIAQVRVPTLIVTSQDDPFVPTAPFRDPAVAKNPSVTVMLTPHGGHCGFFTAERDGYDGYWAEQTVVDWTERHTKTENVERRTTNEIERGE